MNIAKYKIYIPNYTNNAFRESIKVANVLMLELANYGIMLDKECYSRLTRTPVDIAVKIACDVLKEYSVGQLNQPLFKGWESRTEFNFNEIVIQIFGYHFQLSGNDIYHPGFMDDLLSNVEISEAKFITLVSDEEFFDYFDKLVNANVVLDRKTSNKLVDIFTIFGDMIEQLPRLKSAETRIAMLMHTSKEFGLYAALRLLKCDPVDVVRYAAAKKNFEGFKLPHDVLYANLSWEERIQSFQYLSSFGLEKLCEDMGMNRGAWERYLSHTHFFGQKKFVNRFPRFYLAAFISLGNKLESAPKKVVPALNHIVYDQGIAQVTPSGNLAYRTFASRIQSAIQEKDFEKIKKLLSERKGYLFRNFATVCNGIKKKDEREFIAFVRECIPHVNVGILFSILSIDTKAKYRVIDVKGDTIIEDANYPPIIDAIQLDIKQYINEKYGFEGQVTVEPSIRNNIVPFLSKNSELSRGTRIPLDDSKFLYFFVHWIQPAYYSRTDIDHSFMCFDSNWKSEVVYFGNQANRFISQSGDITSAPAPNGATEYGKIRLKHIPKVVKYIVPTINVYSGSKFSNNQIVRAGFFLSNSNTFTLKKDITQYELTQPAEFNIPFILDVEKREIVVLDYNRRERMGWTTHSYGNDVKKVILATNTKNYVSIGDLAEMLSGDSLDVSKEIVSERNDSQNNNQMIPEELFSIFSK